MCDPWCFEICRLHLSHTRLQAIRTLAITLQLASASPQVSDRRHDDGRTTGQKLSKVTAMAKSRMSA